MNDITLENSGISLPMKDVFVHHYQFHLPQFMCSKQRLKYFQILETKFQILETKYAPSMGTDYAEGSFY